MRGRQLTVAATALVGTLLAGCGSGGDSGPGTATVHPGSGGNKAAAPVKLDVPSAYDGAKGWDQEIGWVPKDADTDADPVATDGTTVACILRSGSGYTVQARDAVTGKVRWTGAPFTTPPVQDPSARWAMPTPRLTEVREGGRTYFAAWAVGDQPGDALTEDKEITRIAVYPADASGSSVRPLRQVTVPDDRLRSSYVHVGDGGAGLLVTWQAVGDASVTVDPATGVVKRYDDMTKAFPGCSACTMDKVVGVTTKGPVVDAYSDGSGTRGGPNVPGGWRSKDIAPTGKGIDHRYGDVLGVRDGRFVALWPDADADSGVTPTWAAHDLESGRLLARTACGKGDDPDPGPMVTSPNGAYVAYGSVVLDTHTGKGLCLLGENYRTTLKIVSIADDGTAYGVPQDGSWNGTAEVSSKPAAQVTVASGAKKALPAGTIAPVATLNGGALFTLRENGAGLRISVRLSR